MRNQTASKWVLVRHAKGRKYASEPSNGRPRWRKALVCFAMACALGHTAANAIIPPITIVP